MEENEKNNTVTTKNDSVNVSLGTTVFIAAVTAISFLAFVVWVSLKIEGMA